jgi:hypothetical protein
MAEQKQTKRTYQIETLGLPPLKMILVHAENDRRNAALRPRPKNEKEIRTIEISHDDLIKIIAHLKKKE